ncbi:MAG: adenylate/guanylate cyclase domain-containing protein, partial [Methyloligellaceae bacterium]
AGKIRNHHGALIKTMGDAVMAVFSDSRDAMSAAIEIQQELTSLNSKATGQNITLKLGMHLGPCIAITTGGFLDYFGTTVNLAARLQEESQGGDIVISAELAEDLYESHVELIAGLEAKQTVPRGIDLPQTYFTILTTTGPAPEHLSLPD